MVAEQLPLFPEPNTPEPFDSAHFAEQVAAAASTEKHRRSVQARYDEIAARRGAYIVTPISTDYDTSARPTTDQANWRPLTDEERENGLRGVKAARAILRNAKAKRDSQM